MILKKESFVVFGITLVFSCVGNVFSQEMSQDHKWCTGQDGASADQKIKGCTALIQSGRETRDYMLAVSFYNRGNAYASKGDYDTAIRDYYEAIRLNPQHAGAFHNRGRAYAAKSDWDQALQNIDQAIRLNPEHAEAFLGRGTRVCL